MKKLLWAVVGCLLLVTFGFAQADRSMEVAKLMKGLESPSQAQRINAAKLITNSGLQDRGLYQLVAELIKASYLQEHEKYQTDEISWLCKALAASGDTQYAALLKTVSIDAPSSKLRHYAEQSLQMIEEYAKRSQIINQTGDWDDELNAEENRLINMLRSDNLTLRRDSAKILTREFGIDRKVYAVAADALQAMATRTSSSILYTDTVAWLCKALAASGDKSYIGMLQQIHDDTQNVKLRIYTDNALRALR